MHVLQRLGQRQGVGKMKARTWPTGEGCLWNDSMSGCREECAPDEGVLLGLSKVRNFNTDFPECQEERFLVRGRNGITKHGKGVVKGGALLLEQCYGKERLSFLTFTLPPSVDRGVEAAKRWGKIVNHLLVRLRRELASAGLPEHVVGVTEIQEKRFLRDGGLPLHLHLVVVGRSKRGGAWGLSANWLRSAWESVIQSQCEGYGEASFKASVDVQQVKSSVVGYLGKYLSKGVVAIQTVLLKAPAVAELLPSSWYSCTRGLRQAVFRTVMSSDEHGALIEGMRLSHAPERWFSWLHRVEILGGEGERIGSCWCYTLNRAGLELIGMGQSRFAEAGLTG